MIRKDAIRERLGKIDEEIKILDSERSRLQEELGEELISEYNGNYYMARRESTLEGDAIESVYFHVLASSPRNPGPDYVTIVSEMFISKSSYMEVQVQGRSPLRRVFRISNLVKVPKSEYDSIKEEALLRIIEC